MNYRHFKYEGWLYALAFLTALALRFIQLGAMPLSDMEATSALQALHIAQGLKPALGAHPFYILSTSVLFFLYGGAGANFLARFSPAIIGSLLVFVPLLFADERIKPRTGVILAFFFALDPGLVALSRQAASSIFAVTFLLLALGFLNKNRINLAGVFSALALLSGPSVWMGILGLGITWALYQALSFSKTSEPSRSLIPNSSFLIPFLVTFIILGSLFFLAPNGLSAALASIPAFISRWTVASDVPSTRILFSFLIYQPLGIVLALIATARGWWVGSKRIIPLSVWFFVALLLVIFLPSRETADLVWVLLPFWVMAAIELTRNMDVFLDERVEVIGVVFLTVFFWAFIWLNLATMAILPAGDSVRYLARAWLLVGISFVLLLSFLLIAAGWSARVAQIGGVWGLTLALGILGLGGALGSAGLRGMVYPELWHPANLPAQADLLEATVSDMSEWGVGNDYSAPVVIVGINSPALEWTLREHQVTMAETLDVTSSPAFVITPPQDNPALASAYRGQDFGWRQTPSWSATLPKDWLRWITLREMPQNGETIILWARDDLFVDAPSP
jgi:hypothetical protein